MGASPRGHPKYGGRSAGTPNKATAEIRDLARADGPKVFAELVRIALNSENEQTRVAAIKEILDRAYGRSPQPISDDNEGGPVIINVVTGVPRATAERPTSRISTRARRGPFLILGLDDSLALWHPDTRQSVRHWPR